MKHLENYKLFEPWKNGKTIYVYKCIYFRYIDEQYDLTLPSEHDDIVLDYETGKNIEWNFNCQEETLKFFSMYFKDVDPEELKFLGYEIEEVVEFIERFHIQKEADKYNI